MAVADRLPPSRWPPETNVGGVHRTARDVGGPILIAAGIAILAGFVPSLVGAAGTVVGAAATVGGVVSLVEAHTGKRPGLTALGIDTCQIDLRDAGEGSDSPPVEDVT